MGEEETDAGIETENVPVSLRAAPTVYFTKIENKGAIHLVSANDNNLCVYSSSDPLNVKNIEKTQTIDFLCKGLDSKANKILVYGDHECKVGDIDNIATENEDTVEGFDGTVNCASFIDQDRIAVVTDVGLYVFNINTSFVTPSFTLLWMEGFKFSSFGIDIETNEVFVLNDAGLVKKCELNGSIQNSDFMEPLKKTGFLDIAFMGDKKIMFMKDSLGLWSYESISGGWTPVFLV